VNGRGPHGTLARLSFSQYKTPCVVGVANFDFAPGFGFQPYEGCLAVGAILTSGELLRGGGLAKMICQSFQGCFPRSRQLRFELEASGRAMRTAGDSTRNYGASRWQAGMDRISA
jgi:hypothetical protein